MIIQPLYRSIIFNEEVLLSWSLFLISPDVRKLEDIPIKEANYLFKKLCKSWVDQTAREFVPEGADLEKIKGILHKRFVD